MPLYPHYLIQRPCVPDDKTDWSIEWPEYAPVEFTLSRILDSNRPEWADPPDPLAIKNWNHIDGQIDRRSSMGVYDVIDGVPRNPMGRTGIAGRISIQYRFLFSIIDVVYSRQRCLGQVGTEQCG